MSEALTGMLNFIFTTTSAQTVFGECEVANPASARVMENADMREVARYTWRDDASGALRESFRYQIHKVDWQPSI